MAEDEVLRKNRGLGMLLANMGNKNKDNTSKTVIPEVTKVECEAEGFDPESSGFSGWDDISSNQNNDKEARVSVKSTQQSSNEVSEQVSEEVKGNRASECDASSNAPASSGNTGATGDSKKSEGKNDNKGKGGNTTAEVQQKNPEGRNKRKNQEETSFGSGSVSSWASMKTFDDDHDSQWFEDENVRLAELYGGNFIYAKYMDSQPGKVGYYCELCFAEMNARKSLELHCLGMKHLKKKAMWEKRDGPDDNSSRPDRSPNPPPRKAPRHVHQDRRPYSPPPYPPSYGLHDRGPRPPRGQSSYEEHPPPDYRNRRGYYDRRDDFNRYPEDYYSDYRDDYRPPYDEGPYYRRRGSLESRDYNCPPGPHRDTRVRYSQERYNSYERREAPPPPVISSPAGRIPSSPLRTGSAAALFDGIADGQCSELLRSLAVCRVKNSEDAALATNVTTFLVMSLKEFYMSVGPPSVAHILEEIEVKFNIMKDLVKMNSSR